MVTNFDKVEPIALAMAAHAQTHKFMRWVDDDDVTWSKYRLLCSECEAQFAIAASDLKADPSTFARAVQDGLYRLGPGGRNRLSTLLTIVLPKRRTVWERLGEDP